MIDLTNKVALITGGSRGIGASCVELFKKAGARVAFTYKQNRDAADKLIKELDDDDLRAYRVEASDEKSVVECINAVKNDYGKIDILVNNAGIWKQGKIGEMSAGQWRETIEINLTGTFLFSKYAAELMKENKYGRIINITSTAGQRGEPEYSHYAASKGGAISFTKSLAVELSPYNITVNSVAPGWVDTELCYPPFDDEEYKESVRKSIPVGRIATAEDIAGPVLFLATDYARHINGEILNVNGGGVLCG